MLEDYLKSDNIENEKYYDALKKQHQSIKQIAEISKDLRTYARTNSNQNEEIDSHEIINPLPKVRARIAMHIFANERRKSQRHDRVRLKFYIIFTTRDLGR